MFLALVCCWRGNQVLIPSVFFFFVAHRLWHHMLWQKVPLGSPVFEKDPQTSPSTGGLPATRVYSVVLHPDTVDGLGQQLPLVTGTEDVHTCEWWGSSLGLVYTHQRGEKSHKLKSAVLLRRAELAMTRGRQQPEGDGNLPGSVSVTVPRWSHVVSGHSYYLWLPWNITYWWLQKCP